MATATAATGLAMGAAKFFSGRAQQKKAQRFIDNFEWQELKNAYENEQVSTLGTELSTEQANIGAATQTEALRTGGQRALVGGLGRIEAQRNITNRENAANLDQQQAAINTRIANQEVVNQAAMEKRQGDELAGYGQMMNQGMALKYQGMDNAINAVGAFGQGAIGQGLENKAAEALKLA